MIGYYSYLPSKVIMVNFLRPSNKLNACLSMLLYLYSALVRLLLANVIGLRMVLSGAISCGHVVPSLVCNMVAPNPILDASVSRYRGLVSS